MVHLLLPPHLLTPPMCIVGSSGGLAASEIFTCEVQLEFWRFASRKGLLPHYVSVAGQPGKQFSTEKNIRLRTRYGSRVPVCLVRMTIHLCMCVHEIWVLHYLLPA